MTAAVALPSELEARPPVWIALSELYLDTDVTTSYAYIVHTLAASPYSTDTLHEILFDEVHPVLYHNLLSMVGVWAGFDEAWLVERVSRMAMRPRPRRRFRRWIRLDIDTHWRALEPQITQARVELADAASGSVMRNPSTDTALDNTGP